MRDQKDTTLTALETRAKMRLKDLEELLLKYGLSNLRRACILQYATEWASAEAEAAAERGRGMEL